MLCWYVVESILKFGLLGYVLVFFGWIRMFDLDVVDFMSGFCGFYFDSVMMDMFVMLMLVCEMFGFDWMVVGSDIVFGLVVVIVNYVWGSEVLNDVEKMLILEMNLVKLFGFVCGQVISVL